MGRPLDTADLLAGYLAPLGGWDSAPPGPVSAPCGFCDSSALAPLPSPFGGCAVVVVSIGVGGLEQPASPRILPAQRSAPSDPTSVRVPNEFLVCFMAISHRPLSSTAPASSP